VQFEDRDREPGHFQALHMHVDCAGIATRYEKRAVNSLAMPTTAAITLRLCHLKTEPSGLCQTSQTPSRRGPKSQTIAAVAPACLILLGELRGGVSPTAPEAKG
jgi:hypothetical protein